MNASAEDRGIKGDCTPLMEAASAGHVDIVSLLIAHGADVNAQSTSGNTPLMYGCAGGHEEVVRVLLEAGANVEDHNENGHTPLMEAASAGHVSVAKILLENGAGINTHSNEFKESALTLACYKGHLDMVRFLLEAGADQEHKTDEMHTALMEASMDGHVEVARLLLDSGAQVNMPTDSFESPLTLAACGGHVDLAMLLIERGANIEEVNDEGYTPLMEAAREGHEEMVALLLSQGANINAQTEETQETALTLACCGGFLEVADFLIKAGADIELGASTPLMEAAQEGHLDLVRYLLETSANVHAQTQTGDTALTYACENGHTDVADLLLQYGADLEHESEGGRTPLMKACRAGHLCTVQFLISKRADVNRQTTNNDHTPLSLACAGGHLSVVELLLAQSADPFHKLKDNSTMLIEAAKGGHTSVVQLLLDYPHSIMLNSSHNPAASMLLSQSSVNQQDAQLLSQNAQQTTQCQQSGELNQSQNISSKHNNQKSLLRKNRTVSNIPDVTLTSSEVQQVRNQPFRSSVVTIVSEDTNLLDKHQGNNSGFSESNVFQNSTHTVCSNSNNECRKNARHEQILHKQQILEELQRVERELQIKTAGHLFLESSGTNSDEIASNQMELLDHNNSLPATNTVNTDQTSQLNSSLHDVVASDNLNDVSNELINRQGTTNIRSSFPFYKSFEANKCYIEGFKEGINIEKRRLLREVQCLQENQLSLPLPTSVIENFSIACNFPSSPSVSVITVPAPTAASSNSPCSSSDSAINFTCSSTVTASDETCTTISSQPTIINSDTNQNSVLNDRPKVKAFSKKENKSVRKTVHGMVMNKLQQQHMALMAGLSSSDFQKFLEKTRPHCVQQVHQLQQLNQQLQLQLDQVQHTAQSNTDQMEQNLTKLYREGVCPFLSTKQRSKPVSDEDEILKLEDGTHIPIDEAVNIFESISFDEITNDETEKVDSKRVEINKTKEQYSQIGNQIVASITNRSEPVREYFAVPVTNTPSASSHSTSQSIPIGDQNEVFETSTSQPLQKQKMLNAFEAGLSLGIQCMMSDDNFQAQLLLQSNQLAFAAQTAVSTSTANAVDTLQSSENDIAQSIICNTNQVQVATQTQLPVPVNTTVLPYEKKSVNTTSSTIKGKKTRFLLSQQQTSSQQSISSSCQQSPSFSTQNYQLDPTSISNSYSNGTAAANFSSNQITPAPFSCMDVDSETDSNHDTALTLACAGGHEELVELLLSRGADIEHRDKKGFTPLILAATAGHQKVVEILLNHGADIEAQSERTKDTPLSLACSGGRYEVVELLLNRGANKEHRNVSDYTPLSLAASGGYVNIIKLLLSHGAEINSRTGSKLGISPLMLAAMNGHTAAVKLLLDMGSDINAQIETNRNTALTLACFQGRHEVVSLLLDRKANVEHRAKTGLTPLMEAASGGYVEVGRVLLNKGADVNATPVPSSRDTALTIAADKGHCRFVELLLSKGTQVEVKNKKGNSPLWLAANGGHLNVVDLLYHAGADIDSQDNRKVSCLMAAFRKGHIKVVKWMVNHVTQFPSDQEMTRYIATINDKEILERCQECVKIIRAAKETQAAKANKNATILLEELDMEKTREESKKAAAARRRERKKKKKLEKKEEKRKLHEENKKNDCIYDDKDDNEIKIGEEEIYRDESDHDIHGTCEQLSNVSLKSNRDLEEIDKDDCISGIDISSLRNCSNNDPKSRDKKKEKRKKKALYNTFNSFPPNFKDTAYHLLSKNTFLCSNITPDCLTSTKSQDFEKHPADREDFEFTGNDVSNPSKGRKSCHNFCDAEVLASNSMKLVNSTSPKQCGKRDEGWKEVVRKGQVDDTGKFMNSPFRSKKVSVPPNAISRVIGRGGSNINTIRAATGAHIEVEKQSKSQGERIITIKGSSEAIKHAHVLIAALIKDPDVDILQMLPKSKTTTVTTSSWDKSIASTITCKFKVAAAKLPIGLITSGSNLQVNKPNYISNITSTTHIVPLRPVSNTKHAGPSGTKISTGRVSSNADKKMPSHFASLANTKTTMSYTSAIMTAGRATKIVTTNSSQTFAAKLSEVHVTSQLINTNNCISQCSQNTANVISQLKQSTSPTNSIIPSSSSAIQIPLQQSTNNSENSNSVITIASSSFDVPSRCSEKVNRSINPVTLALLNNPLSQSSSICTMVTSVDCISSSNSTACVSQSVLLQQQFRSSTPISTIVSEKNQGLSIDTPLEYSLFNDTFSKVTQQTMWGSKENENNKNINFATVAGGGLSVNSSTILSNKYIDSRTVEADVSKAPGYRGTLVCSPTLNKPNISHNLSNSVVSVDAVTSASSASIQTPNNYTGEHANGKSPVSLVVARPIITHKNSELNVTNITHFTGPVFHTNVDSSQTAGSSHNKTCNISPISQTNLNVDIFNDNIGYENQNVNSNLLKIVSSEGQSNAQSMLTMPQHIQNYPQTVAPSASVTTTISMSRLNPRAPDFSSSLHLNNKPQVSMFNTGVPMHANIFPSIPTQPSSTIQSSNITMLGSFAFNKYPASSQRQNNLNIASCNQNRWSFIPAANYAPPQDAIIGQVNFSDHLSVMSTHSGNIDVINIENCSTPTNSSSSTVQVASHEISQLQIEDRKIPRPIGMERTWKNYSTITGPGGDADNINWMINNDKHMTLWPGVSPNMGRTQLYCSTTNFNRIPSTDADLHQLMDSSYQGNRFGS